MHYYSAYGCLIASSFPLPELLACTGARRIADIVISEGQVPENLDSPEDSGVVYEARANTFLLTLDDVGRFLVEDGERITVEPAKGSLASDIRVFLLGSCFGALLHQRGILALHASAIESEQGTVLFMGNSGMGKSTTLQAFIQRGYKMLADDITGVVLNDAGEAVALPAFPRTKLWQDSAKCFAIDTGKLERVRPQLEKFELRLHEHFRAEPLKLHKLYLLNSTNEPEVTLESLAKPKQFQTILFNTYRARFLGGLAMRDAHFKLATKLANQTTISRINRPSHPFMLDELIELIEQDIQNEVANHSVTIERGAVHQVVGVG